MGRLAEEHPKAGRSDNARSGILEVGALHARQQRGVQGFGRRRLGGDSVAGGREQELDQWLRHHPKHLVNIAKFQKHSENQIGYLFSDCSIFSSRWYIGRHNPRPVSKQILVAIKDK